MAGASENPHSPGVPANEAKRMLGMLAEQAKKGNKRAREEYNALERNGKRRWYWTRWSIDPKATCYLATETLEAKEEEVRRDLEDWMAPLQILKLENVPEIWPEERRLARLQDLVAGCPTRPSSKPALAAKGELEYFYRFHAPVEFSNSRSASSTVTAQADADQASFEAAAPA